MQHPKHLPILPEMGCELGCDECCRESFPVSESELERVLLYANEHDLRPQVERPEMCPWFQPLPGVGASGCIVHEARPLICHLFGHLPSMQGCPRGHVGMITTEAEAQTVLDAHKEAGPAVRYLGEVLDAAMPDPTKSVWRARVSLPVWEQTNRMRETFGLVPLERKEGSAA